MNISIMDFEKFCKGKRFTQFIFNTSDQPNKRIGMGNCNSIMRFATVHVVLCPDTVYFRSKHKESYIAFANITGIEYESSEAEITNTIYIKCKDPDDSSKEETYIVLAQRT